MNASRLDDAAVLSARDLLSFDRDALGAAVVDALAQGDLSGAVATAGRNAGSQYLVAQAGRALDEILGGIELGEVLMGAWGQLDDVRTAIADTGRDGTTRQVKVASHTVTSEHEPSIEVVVNEMPKKLLDVPITLGLEVASCDLVIERGTITGAQVGPLSGSGAVTALDLTIAKCQSATLDPKRLFRAAPQSESPAS